jgi:hypothetical protein
MMVITWDQLTDLPLVIRTPTNDEVDDFFLLCDQLLTGGALAAEGVGQRYGQYVFNRIHQAAPAVANQLRGSRIDPFYKDEKVDAFLTAVLEMYVELGCCETASDVAEIIH